MESQDDSEGMAGQQLRANEESKCDDLFATWDEFKCALFAPQEREFFPFFWAMRLLRASVRFIVHRRCVQRLVSLGMEYGRPCM